MKKSNQNINQENTTTVSPVSSNPIDSIREIITSGNDTLKVGMENNKEISVAAINAYKEMYTNGENPELDKMALDGISQTQHDANERLAEYQAFVAKMESSALLLIRYAFGFALIYGIGSGKINMQRLEKFFGPVFSSVMLVE